MTKHEHVLFPAQLREKLRNVAKLESGKFTVAIGPRAIMLVSPNIQAIIEVENQCDTLMFEGVYSDEIRDLIGATYSLDAMFIEFSSQKGAMRYLRCSEIPDTPVIPRPSAWLPIPYLGHIKPLLASSDALWCDSLGNFCVAGTFTSAAIVPETLGKEGNYYAINIKGILADKVLKAGAWTHYCILSRRLFLKEGGEIASIAHEEFIPGMSPKKLIDFCHTYRRQGRMKITGALSFYQNDVLTISWDAALRRGVIDAYGRIVGRFDCDISEDFEVAISEMDGVTPLLELREIVIYVPDQLNQPVAFRTGSNWAWAMALP